MDGMMAEKATKRITCNLTESEHAIAEQLAKQDRSMSEYLLRLIREDAERQGIEWDIERNTWGDTMRIERIRKAKSPKKN